MHTVAEKQQYFHSLLIYTQDFGINRTLSDRLEGMSAELLTPAHSATRAEVKENIYIHQEINMSVCVSIFLTRLFSLL